jgi:hypothetical protein
VLLKQLDSWTLSTDLIGDKIGYQFGPAKQVLPYDGRTVQLPKRRVFKKGQDGNAQESLYFNKIICFCTFSL